MIAWYRKTRAALEPTSTRPFPVVILFHRNISRWGYTGTVANLRDQYGQLGSQGYSFTLNVWRNPR